MSNYAKAIYLFLAAVLAGIAPLVSGNPTQAELVNVVILALGAFVTYLAPEMPGTALPYIKTGIAAAMAGLAVVVSFIHAGGSLSNIPPAEWVQIAVAILGVIVGPIHQAAFPAPQKAAA